MSSSNDYALPTPPAHHFSAANPSSPRAASAGALAGPGPSTSAHRAGGSPSAVATDLPATAPKKRGRPRKNPAATANEDQGEPAAPPVKRAAKAVGEAGRRVAAKKVVVQEPEDDSEDEEDEYVEEESSEEDLDDDDDDEDDEDEDEDDDALSVSSKNGRKGGGKKGGKGKKRARDDDESGSDASSATSRSSSRGGSTRPTKASKHSVVDRGGIRLKSSLRYILPPAVPRAFRLDNLEELMGQLGDVNNTEGLDVLPEELRDALEDAMDPETAENLLDTIDSQLALYDRAWTSLNAELTKAQVEESVLGNVKLIASNKRDEIRHLQKTSRAFSPP
ncbi:hypothetical protein JCM10450v2_008036 [Rhodotorula kratochvilovae]